jgi:Tfp pilus assembly protein PilO
MKLDKKTITFLILALFFLIELTLLLPLSLSRIVVINKERAAVKKNLEYIGREWPNKDNYVSRQEELTSRIAALRRKFIGSEDKSRLLSFISQAAKNHGVQIQSMLPADFAPYPDSKFGEFAYFPVKIRARSRYHDLGGFFDFIQNSRYFFEVKEITMKSGSPYNVIDMTIRGLMEKQ